MQQVITKINNYLIFIINKDINNKIDVLFSNRALCFTAIKKFKKAIYDLEKAIDLNPKSIKAYKRLFNLHLSLGNFGVNYICYNKKLDCRRIWPKVCKS